ncbi:radical SAM protein [Cupriavidus sp. AcVe19-6a]|uniref:radical SAM protein n=1 Tax=Cupriavidus sp. AcVe19-6a TaxID=2821358 RepID=UPI001AE2A827|nr:hypothetical protein [Cupriavidus sp. AcVe19-6a]
MDPSTNGPLPIWIWIDPTRRCNLACNLCYTKNAHSQEDLSITTFVDIVERVCAESRISIHQMTLNWRGEPTLNRNFPAMLGFLKQHYNHFPVEFHTNATALTTKNSTAIVEACGPNVTICISIDGGNEASHDAQRGPGTYRRAIRGAHAILRARGTRGYPKVVLHQLDLRVNNDSYDADFLELSTIVDEWQQKFPIIPGGERRLFKDAPLDPKGSAIITEWPRTKLPSVLPKGSCFWAGNALCIAPNGDASICLLAHDPTGILGNVISEEVWLIVTKARKWRENLMAHGRGSMSHCELCRMEEGNISAAWSASTRRTVDAKTNSR